MRAAIYEGLRTIRMAECVPAPPGPGEAQLHISHCGICGTDLRIFRGMMDARVRPPRILGHEMAGTVMAVGPAVPGFSAGDRVTVMPLISCGHCPACRACQPNVCHSLQVLGVDMPGAFQSLLTVPADTLHRLPNSLPLEHAALLEPLAVACRAIRLGDMRQGVCAVVIGGGPIGLLTALAARHAGATVLLSGRNAFRRRLALGLGLDAFDPAATNLMARVADETGGTGADVVVEATGTAEGAGLMTKLARVRGRIVSLGLFFEPPPLDLLQFFRRELLLLGSRVYEHVDFDAAIRLAAAGAIPFNRIITRVYPLADLAAGLLEIDGGAPVMKAVVSCLG